MIKLCLMIWVRLKAFPAMDIDPTTAHALFNMGAKLIMLDAPANLDFGCDLNSWQIGPRFKGLKLIPPGIHFIFYSINSSSCTTFRTGFFHEFKNAELVVKRWNADTEEFVDMDDKEQLERIASSITSFNSDMMEMDRFLGAFPLVASSQQPVDTYKKWQHMSSFISMKLIKRILPSMIISSMRSSSRYSDDWQASKRQDLEQVASLSGTAAKKMPQNEIGEWVNFTDVDMKLSFPAGASQSDITMYSLDKSYLLDITLAQNFHSPIEIIGELNLCFTLFHLGQFYDGFAQWKTLLLLLCQSEVAIKKYPQVFRGLVGKFILTKTIL